MATSLIRSRRMITRTLDHDRWEEIADGAVLQKDGVIAAVGTYADLHARYPDAPVIGSGREILLPGFVNGHHHVGLTPVQLGSPDMPLELWFVTRMVARNLNLYLDTLYSAFEMVGSGITTVQHIHGWMPGSLEEVEARSNEVLRAYRDIGMRVSYCFAVRDQNRLVYQADMDFVASLPAPLQDPMKRWFERFQMSLEDNFSLFRSLHAGQEGASRAKIQLAPANLHWCSDAALEGLAGLSESYDVPMHMHLVETAYQKAYAEKRGGGTALEYLDRFGMLGPRLTLGHGVWLNESDIDRVAATGTCICHNCSSNFRLRSGVAALNRFEAKGINTAIGLDEAASTTTATCSRRCASCCAPTGCPAWTRRRAEHGAGVRMATVGGARTTPYGDGLGRSRSARAPTCPDRLGPDRLPVSRPGDALLDAVIQRAKTGGVTAV
ncbi:amidohydrolase, partial [Methylobacterium radiotolerans]